MIAMNQAVVKLLRDVIYHDTLFLGLRNFVVVYCSPFLSPCDVRSQLGEGERVEDLTV